MFFANACLKRLAGSRDALKVVFKAWVATMTVAVLTSCRTTPTELLHQREDAARPKPAAIANDAFYFENGYSDKTPDSHEFFFKRCELSRRHPYPSSLDFACNDPE